MLLRGGQDTERLYLKDLQFVDSRGSEVHVTASTFVGANMGDVLARHLARYYFASGFSRPGFHVLDFPCGSGYGAHVFAPFKVQYTGLDRDPTTVEYARRIYGTSVARFDVGDLTCPVLPADAYDLIACLEGLEHILPAHQPTLVGALFAALRSGGMLVISTPQAEHSGTSTHNPHHLGELTRVDFVALLSQHFTGPDIELVTQRNVILSTGAKTTNLLAICHKSLI